jgi:hypothetical protein
MANVPPAVIQDAKRKAAEFENFDWKRRREDSDAKFIQAFKSLPLKSFATKAEKKEAIMKLLQ